VLAVSWPLRIWRWNLAAEIWGPIWVEDSAFLELLIDSFSQSLFGMFGKWEKIRHKCQRLAHWQTCALFCGALKLRAASWRTLHTAVCTLHSALCTLHTAHCTLHTALCALCALCCCVLLRASGAHAGAASLRALCTRRSGRSLSLSVWLARWLASSLKAPQRRTSNAGAPRGWAPCLDKPARRWPTSAAE